MKTCCALLPQRMKTECYIFVLDRNCELKPFNVADVLGLDTAGEELSTDNFRFVHFLLVMWRFGV